MIKIAVGIILSALGLFIAFRDVDWPALRTALSEANGLWILVSAFFTVISVWIRAMRWRILLGPLNAVRTSHLFSATMVGYFGNGVLPMRAGEVIKSYMVSRLYPDLAVSSVLGTVVVERLLDLCGLMLVSLWIAVTFDLPGWVLSGIAGVAIGLIGGLGVLGVAAFAPSHRIEALGRRLVGRWRWMSKPWRILETFLTGMAVLRRAGHTTAILGQTLVYWFCQWSMMLTAAWGLNQPLTWMESGTLLLGTMLAASLPSAPANLGLFHAAAVLTMTAVLHYPQPDAQAYAIASHAIRVLLPTVLGGILALAYSWAMPAVWKGRWRDEVSVSEAKN